MKVKFLLLPLMFVSSFAHAQTPASPSKPFSRPRIVMPAAPTSTQGVVAKTPTASPSPAPIVQKPTPTSTQTTALAPNASASSVVRTPASAPPAISTVVAPTAAWQPIRPLSPDKIRARLTEAQRLCKTRLTPSAMNPSINFVTLAALDPESSNIHLLTLPKQTFLTRDVETTLTSSLGALLRVKVIRSNYVNTAVMVSDLTGRQYVPLAVEYPIEKGGAFRETAFYTSAHPALLSPELVKTGQAYVRTMIDLAAKRLKGKGVAISPAILDTAERLCLVEHVDHDRFRKENRLALYDEVYSLYALNELDTFRYSVSIAGAGGMVQMIPWTYQMIRQRHPAIGLNPDFVLGMRNHGNALEAMLLYMQDTWNDLALNPDIDSALNSKLATQAELLAAGYNSNPARLAQYIRRGGSNWRFLIPRETQTYLQIYHSLESLMSFKAHDGKTGGSTPSNKVNESADAATSTSLSTH